MRPDVTTLLGVNNLPTKAERQFNGKSAEREETRLVFIAILLAGVLCSGFASAAVQPTNTLGSTGTTDLQIRTGNGVQAVCGQFIAANSGDNPVPPAGELEADLFDKCGEMVHTGRTVTGDAGGTGKSLNLSAEELASALQNIAGEEAAAGGSMATEASAGQAANIGKRLSALLSRSSSLQLSAVNVFGRDALYTLSDEDLNGANGGNAGEGDLLESRWGVFINGDFGSGEKDASDGEDGFSYDATGFTAGIDYRINNEVVLGVAAGFNNSKSDFDSSFNVSGGSMDSENTSLSTYGLFYKGNYFFDSILTVGQGNLDMDRRIVILSNSEVAENDGADRTAVSDTDSSQIAFSFGGGTEIVNGSIVFAPYVRVNSLNVKVDAFEETGAQGLNLKVGKQTIKSLSSSLGFRVSSATNTSFGVLIPQGRLEWIHEFSDDNREIKTIYVNDPRQNELIVETDDPDRDYFSMGLGLSAVFKGGTQAFVDVKSIIGLNDFSEAVVTVGARFEL